MSDTVLTQLPAASINSVTLVNHVYQFSYQHGKLSFYLCRYVPKLTLGLGML